MPVHWAPCQPAATLRNVDFTFTGSRLRQMARFHPSEGSPHFDDGFTVASAQRNRNLRSHEALHAN